MRKNNKDIRCLYSLFNCSPVCIPSFVKGSGLISEKNKGSTEKTVVEHSESSVLFFVFFVFFAESLSQKGLSFNIFDS